MSNPGKARYGFIRIAFAQILAVTQHLAAVFTIVLIVYEDNLSKSDLNSPPPPSKNYVTQKVAVAKNVAQKDP